MSKLVKIYDGMTFDMSTGEVLSHGDVTYHAEEDIAQCGGGGPSTQTTTSGFATEYKPQISSMLADAEGLYRSNQLGQVAGFSQTGLDAQAAGLASAANQTGLEQSMYNVAQQPLDTSGMRAKAIGGSRQALDQNNIKQGLAAQFAGIDQQAQQNQMANMNAAIGAQGQGAQTMGMIGQAQQAQAQSVADAPYTALAQRVGLFSGVAPKEQTTTKTGGK
jgi:hypothetical protein